MMLDATTTNASGKAGAKPPVASAGVLGWIRSNLFSTWYNSLLTIAALILLWKTVLPFIRWAFIDSLWFATSRSATPPVVPAGR